MEWCPLRVKTMYLQKPLEMQSGETSLQYVFEDGGIISV